MLGHRPPTLINLRYPENMTEARLKAINTVPIEKATDRPWAEWLKFMAGIGAADLDHKQIAKLVEVELGNSVDNTAWWAQGITVAYEQHSGRRLPGQQADGTFQMSVSRTTDLSVGEAFAAWQVFAAADPTVTEIVTGASKTGGSAKRRTWRAAAGDGSAFMFTSELRPNGKTAVLINHMRLATQDENLEAKERWTAVLDTFVATL